MKRGFLAILAIGFLMIGMVGGANASSIYNFDVISTMPIDSYPSFSGSFQITVQSDVTSEREFGPIYMDSYSLNYDKSVFAFAKLVFTPNLSAGGGYYDAVGLYVDKVDGSGGIAGGFFFEPGSFSKVGKHDSIDTGFHFGEGILTVSHTVAPVPGAIWLMGSGLIGLLGISRKKK